MMSFRRHFIGVSLLFLSVLCLDVQARPQASIGQSAQPATVEQWDIFELTLKGPAGGNPFIDVKLSARFKQAGRTVEAAGFYDGDGTFKIRFMPDSNGLWRYETVSNRPELSGKKGSFAVTQPAKGNHGLVRVYNTFHFAYADGMPYKPLGTTAYVWTHQSDELQEQTLKTLAASPFNKIRFCVFPKRYVWNTGEPQMYPFEGTPGDFDTARPNPKFFRHFEQRIRDLQKLGIEADIILFHPYDNGAWGFDRMASIEDDRYLRYVVARFAAFRNVWWSLANEYDFMQYKSEDDWERMGQLVSRSDPYHHLLGIHNGHQIFNQTRPWITHASMQNGAAVEDPNAAGIYRDAYRKPVVYDEAKYEGNISHRWGNISAEEMVYRFWNGTVAGTYVGHGETYTSPDEVLWWSKGGVLKGQSPARLAFLKQVLDDAPAEGIEPLDKWQNPEYGGKPSEYYLVYLGRQTLSSWEFRLPKPPASKVKGQPPQMGMKFTVEVLDTWNMTVTPVPGVFTLAPKDNYFFADKDGRSVTLPGRPYMALRILRQH
jgi:hypothetical protein